MRNTSLALAIAASAALGTSAWADTETQEINTKAKTKIERGDDGSYKESKEVTHEKTGESGSASSKTSVTYSEDEHGNRKKESKTEVTKDPDGLFNKEKTVTEDSMEEKDGKTKEKHAKKVNGRTIESSERETER